MSAESNTDRDGFFDIDEFADIAVIGNITVTGLFDASFVRFGGIDTEAPTFIAPTSALSMVDYDDTIQISGTDYTVRSVQPDFTGMTTLVLSEQ